MFDLEEHDHGQRQPRTVDLGLPCCNEMPQHFFDEFSRVRICFVATDRRVPICCSCSSVERYALRCLAQHNAKCNLSALSALLQSVATERRSAMKVGKKRLQSCASESCTDQFENHALPDLLKAGTLPTRPAHIAKPAMPATPESPPAFLHSHPIPQASIFICMVPSHSFGEISMAVAFRFNQ